MKTAVVIVSHGTTDEAAKRRSLDRIADTLRKELPCPVYEAYYGDMAVRRFPTYRWESVAEELRRNGVERVVAAPTFMSSGKTWREFREQIVSLTDTIVMNPLLENDDVGSLALLLLRLYAPTGTGNVLLVGHGAGDESDHAYRKLEMQMAEQSGATIHIELLHGGSRGEGAFRQMLSAYHGPIALHPLLITAGHHVQKDVFGERNSLAARIQAQGYAVEPHQRALGEYPEFGMYLSGEVQKYI